MYDRDGDGWGDTWYAGGNPPVDLDRPYRDRGVPPRFKAYDRAFLRWLGAHRAGRRTWSPRTTSRSFASGDDLRTLYDLVVFSGHSEYMTGHAYDVIERFRDLGGRLIFLSADNFFWRVDKSGDTMRKIKPFREEGRPEARIAGVAVPRQRRRQAPGRLHRRRRRGGAVALRQDGPRDGLHLRRDRRRLRDRDRRDDAGLPAGDDRARPAHRPLRAGPQRRDDLLRDRRRRAGLRRRLARLRRLGDIRGRSPGCWRTSGSTCWSLPPPPPGPGAAPAPPATLRRARHRPAGRRRRRARSASPAGRRSLTRSQWIAELLTPPRSV